MVKSFFLNESGFVAPWTALSGSWIAGILVGATTLFGVVGPAFAGGCVVKCNGWEVTIDCGEGLNCTEVDCSVEGSRTIINVECS